MKKFITLALMLTAFCGVSMADDTYTVAGDNTSVFGSSWDENDTDNDMVKCSGTYYRKAYYNVSTGTVINFKVVKNRTWSTAFPASDYNYTVSGEGASVVVIEFNTSTSSVWVYQPAARDVFLAYNEGSGWKVGDKLSYNKATGDYSVDIVCSKERWFVLDTSSGLVKDADYAWGNPVRPSVGSGNYDLYWEHMKGTITTSGSSSWYNTLGSATFTLTYNEIYDTNKTFTSDVTKTLNVNSTAGWATFSLGTDGNNTGYTVSGADAFYVSDTADGKAVLTSIASGKKIPTYPNGIMLKKIGGGDVTITTTEESDVTLTGNMLQGSGRYTTWAIPSDQGYTGYTLQNDLVEGLGFYPVLTSDNVMPAYKAFLKGPDPATLGARAFFSLEEETTGIKYTTVQAQQTNEYFNLAGQRVAQPTKGLYIVNGKKVIIK